MTLPKTHHCRTMPLHEQNHHLLSKTLTSATSQTILSPRVVIIAAKSLELFLQELCDRTYLITLERGAKTVSSLHL
ncbi:hypothetical protein F2Q69_00031818 [Brassica cretica]|uniref:Transcription factor CBF/NF-Y/archaeal histone domain-containing protein n=1 Tax=Brassica cretica TaxID=69181 RepID=A0A8S9S7B9_BRACR|nr:hypothetical protein F2Q69_00031818 [Brassica cretica]